MVMLTDMGAGIIITHIVGKIFNYKLPFYFYLIGMFLALLPDFPVFLLRIRGREIRHHRGVDHYPIIIIPIFLILILFSFFWVVVAGLCVLAHLIHDSLDKEEWGGIKWLAPFSKKNYRLFGKKDGRRKLIVSCTEKEAERMASLQPPPPFEEWIEKIWLKPTLESISGIVIFSAAIILYFIW